MAAYYPLFEDETKQGPPGIPGIGFKLTNDGNYDMEDKILKNCRKPEDDNDATTKLFVAEELVALKDGIRRSTETMDESFKNYTVETSNKIKSLETGLQQTDDIRKDLQSEIAVLREASLIQNLDGVFDARNIPMKNLGKPIDGDDAVTKKYVDLKMKINDKRDDNLLKRDDDGLYAPSLMQNGHYNFDNKRLTNVSSPIDNSDAVTKEYSDGQIFHATTEKLETYGVAGFQPVMFNKFSSQLLTHDLNLTCEMEMKVTIYLRSPQQKTPLIKLSIGGHHVLERPLETNIGSCVVIVFGRKDKQLLLEISPDGKENKIKPHIVVEKINYL